MTSILIKVSAAFRPFFPWVGCLVLAQLTTSPAQAAPYRLLAAGDRITNVASGDFVDPSGVTQTINSNPVELSISEVRALQLVSNVSQLGLIGGQVSFPHLLTNTGNVRDQYTLTLNQSSSDQFDLSNVAVYADRNQDGLPDDALNLLGTSNAISLDAGQSLALVVTGLIPVNRVSSDQAILNLTATNSTSLNQTVTDTTRVTSAGVLNVTKAEDKSTGPLNATITYTLTYTNSGNSATRLVLTDVLDGTQLAYVTGSARWNQGSGALTEASGEAAGNTGIDYQTSTTGSQTTVSIILPSVPAQSTGQISFQARAVSTTQDQLANTASYQQIDGSTTVKTANTNTVLFNLTHSYAVVTNNSASSASNNGNPSSSPDNLVTVASAQAGTEVWFDNYVWNTGDTQNVYNLSTSLTNVPSCAQVRLYQPDGLTPLTDSNGDGLPDTGPIEAGAMVRIRVGLRVGSGCQSTNTPLQIDLTAASALTPGVSDPVRNQLSAIVGNRLDLYNGDQSGKQPQGIDNSGAAWISKIVDAAGRAVFPLTVANLGSQPDSYLLLADQDGTLGSASDLPTGWTVRFFASSTADCSVLGSEMGRIDNVPAGGSVAYCAVVQAPKGQASQPIWFAVRSASNGSTDAVKDQVNVGNVRQLVLTTDQQGTVAPGGTLVYVHTLSNAGSLTEGATAGSLLVSLDTAQANGLIHTVYYDANNNGVLDPADPQVSDLAALGVTNGAVGLSPGESIRLLVKVQAPPGSPLGLQGSVRLVATPVGVLGGLTAAAVSNIDLTTLSAGELRLTKTQALDASCDGTADGSFQLSGLAIRPGQCVVYQIQATNEGSQTLTNVTIRDTVPPYTTLQVPPAPSVTQGTVDLTQVATTGELAGVVGTLLPGQSASLRFAIQVQPQ